jgi:hypothetical protein
MWMFACPVSLVCYCSSMARGEIPEEATPAARGPGRPPRSTPELIVELQLQARVLTVAAIAVVNDDVTQFVFAVDEDPLATLNALIRGGGHPIGIVGARIGRGMVEFHAEPFVEFQHNRSALAYLQSLRVPFLTLLQTHVDRMPDSPGNN